MKNLWQDVRYGARVLWKRPGFTAVAVLALALGIGANTAIFSVVNSVLLRPLPYPQPERLVRVTVANVQRGTRDNPAAYLDFADWQQQTNSFEALAAYSSGSASLTGDGSAPEQLNGVVTTPDMFKVMGVSPALGRTFTAEEAARIAARGEKKEGAEGQGSGAAAAPQVVVIGHGLWQRRFGGDPSIVGRDVMLDNAPSTVVGVMPEGFRYPLDYDEVEFWAPLDTSNEFMRHRGASFLDVVARLKSGVSQEQASAELAAVSERLAADYPNTNRTRRAETQSLHERLVGDIRPALLVLLGAVGCVLLIACANVANLLLVRAASRQKEFAVRTALGASRWRIMRQLLTESFLLSLAGGVAGLLFALWGVDLLLAVVPADIPRMGGISTDARVLVFTLGATLATGLVFGLAPALQASKTSLNESLKEGERGSTASRNRLRGGLIVAEVALSLVLLAGAGLLVKSFWKLTAVNPGFNPEGVLTATMTLSDNKYEEDDQQREAYRRALERVAAMPGIDSAGLISPLPMSGNSIGTNFTVNNNTFDAPENVYRGERKAVSADALRTLGIPVVRGRAFTERDGEGAPRVFLVSEELARKCFPDGDALGRQMSMRDLGGISTGEIVGIVTDVKYEGLDAETPPAYYVSYLQTPSNGLSVVVRARAGTDAAALAPTLRAAVLEADKDQPLAEVRTMSAMLANSLARERFQMLLLSIFAGTALLLAAVGLFGVMSYTVAQRTHEIGIRMALGAQTRDVMRLIIGRGMALTLAGVGVGLVGAFALTRLMSGLLYGVSAHDPATFALVTALLVIVAFLSCYLPARRATKVDPMVALRYE
ncbi:MAG TPA: ABC transporter permease [Pyrinomonadaceae bacterium]